MKKKLLLLPVAAIAAIAILAGTAMAQSNPYTDLQTMPVMGSGVAVSSSNSAVFRQISIAVANRNAGTTTTTLDYLGVLGFAGERLNIASIGVSSSGTLSGTLQRNGATVGSFTLTPVSEDYHLSGTVTLDGTTYNAYVFQKAFFGWGWGRGFPMHGMMYGIGNNVAGSGLGNGMMGGY